MIILPFVIAMDEHAQSDTAQRVLPGLYIIATPLGHARDITLRALDILRAADLVLCEDTRVSRNLLARYHLKPQLRAYHDHNEVAMVTPILTELAAGKVIALISDAGTPVISDPGYRVVAAAREAGFGVFSVPGPSAPIAALSVSGLPSDRFSFLGFLPARQTARQKALAALNADFGTIILFESPNRLQSLLLDIESVFGACQAVVAREMTKKFEEVVRGTPQELAAHFSGKVRGECVVLFHPLADQQARPEDVDAALRAALEGLSVRDAAAAVAAKLGLPRKQVYARALSLRGRA